MKGVLGVLRIDDEDRSERFSLVMGVLDRVARGVREERGVMCRSIDLERVTGPVSRCDGRMKPFKAGRWLDRMGLRRGGSEVWG